MATISTFSTPAEVMFGAGALAQLPAKIAQFGARRILLITDKGMRKAGTPDKTAEQLRSTGLTVNIFDDIAGEPSLETLEVCRDFVRKGGYELIVALGGGSAMDTAKGAACLAFNEGAAGGFVGTNLIPKPGLPVIALPTTAGTAAEVTPNAIFADNVNRVKSGIVSPYLLPKVALVDPELTHSVPPAITAATGMDALVHAIESYISPKASPFTQPYALKAIQLIQDNLRRVVANGKDIAAREAMAWGSLIAGLSFANAGVGGVHALAYPLGGEYHVAHGVSNALLLTPVMRFSASAKPALFADIARALGVPDQGQGDAKMAEQAVEAMGRLSQDVGIPQRMRDVGVPESAIEPMAVAASKIERLLANNARPMTLDDIRNIYRAAW